MPTYKTHAQVTNAGFVPGNIWYSIDPFSEGDKIKIYTMVFNPDSRELSGTVIFFDNGAFLDKKNFTAPPKGVKDISIDWTATVGDHIIFGKIENARFLVSKDKYEEVYLAESETSKSSRTVIKKIITKVPDVTSNTESVIPVLESIKNIERIIESKVPESVTKSVNITANTVDGLRSSMATMSKDKKEEVQNDIKVLNDTKTSTASTGKFIKPFKYVELFFLSFFSFILNNKFIFYSILIITVGLILRYIWNLIF